MWDVRQETQLLGYNIAVVGINQACVIEKCCWIYPSKHIVNNKTPVLAIICLNFSLVRFCQNNVEYINFRN